MRTKRIWLWACVFGLIASVSLYYTMLSAQSGDEEILSAQNDELSAAAEEPMDPTEESTEEKKGKREISIEPGKRAMSLEVDWVEGVSGFIEADSHVDLVYVQRPPEEAVGQHEAATLLLQNIKVLEVGHAADTEEEAYQYQTVTLELTTYEALALGFAKKGEIYLLLRHPEDDGVEPNRTHIHEDELHKGVFRK